MLTENTELVLVANPELVKIVKDKGLEPIEEKTIQTSYQPYFDQMAEIKEAAKKIDFDNPTELDEKIARELRLKTVKIRTGSKDVKDFEELKEGLKLQKQAKAEAERKNDLFFERNKIVSEYDSFYIKGSLTLETTEKEYQDLLLDLEAKKQQHIQAQSEIKRLDELQRKRESEKL